MILHVLIRVKKFNYETLFAISEQLVHCQRNHTPLSYPSQWFLLITKPYE